jgi:hypothetical protein
MLIPNHLSLLINQELPKVPCDLLCFGFLLVHKVRGAPQKLINRVGLLAVDFYLAEQRELYAILVCSLLGDHLIRPWLLVQKLVAWESQDFKALVSVLPVELHHLCVVLLCQASLACNVDDHHTLLILANIA